MKMLLSIEPLYIAIPAVLIIILLIYFLMFKKQKNVKPTSDSKMSNFNKYNVEVELKEKYMYRREIEFLYFLNETLPKNRIALPKVSLDSILSINNIYSSGMNWLNKKLDFVVFDEPTMKPIFVIDIYDNTFSDDILSEQEPEITKLLGKINLPIVSLLVKNVFDKVVAKQMIMDMLSSIDKKDKESEIESDDTNKIVKQ